MYVQLCTLCSIRELIETSTKSAASPFEERRRLLQVVHWQSADEPRVDGAITFGFCRQPGGADFLVTVAGAAIGALNFLRTSGTHPRSSERYPRFPPVVAGRGRAGTWRCRRSFVETKGEPGSCLFDPICRG